MLQSRLGIFHPCFNVIQINIERGFFPSTSFLKVFKIADKRKMSKNVKEAVSEKRVRVGKKSLVLL